MAEVQSRPSASRGRGSTRAGRGGFSSRGGGRSAPRTSNGDSFAGDEESFSQEEDQGQLGLLKKQYQSQLQTLNEFFPDWTDEDLVYALQERNGDLQNTIEDITEGKVTRFADVTKKSKEKSRNKTKDIPISTADTTSGTSRGRGRGGFEAARGGRGGRATDRGRGGIARGGRGGAASALNFGGRNSGTSVPTVESTAWDSTTENATAPGGWDSAAATTSWGGEGASSGTNETEQTEVKSSIIPQGSTKSWASMLATTAAAILPKSITPAVIEEKAEEAASEEKPAPEVAPETNTVEDPEPSERLDVTDHTAPSSTLEGGNFGGSETPADLEPVQAEDAQLESSGDKLTSEALEHVPDVSNPPPTETAASNIDASSMLGSQTPYASSQHVPTLGSERPPLGGFATSAWKATGTPGRNTSYQRIMEQREAVVMPSNHAVDRAAVQFGSMGLNGDNNPLDVEDDREEVETRAQPPQEPLQAQPKASLPPAPQHSIEQHTAHEALPTPKPAPGLDMPSHMPGHGPSQGAPGLGQPSMQNNNIYGQYGRYGGFGHDQSAPAQKPYDAFSQQLNYPQSHETPSSYGAPSQVTGPSTQQGQSAPGGYAQGQNDYTSQYGEPSRGGYSSYYGSSFNQQTSGQQHQESSGPTQQRGGASGYPAAGENAYGSRFGESQVSGSNTPAPGAVAGGQARNPSQQGHQPAQGQTQGGQGGSYQYGGQQSYYPQGSYYQQYMSNYPSYNYGQHSYGQHYNKNNMYGGGPAHQGYGMSPQTSYDQSTPSNASGFGTSGHGTQGRDTGFSSGYGSDYNRANSAAPSQSQQSGYGGGYPSEPSDNYGRGAGATNNAPGGMGQYGNAAGTPSTTAAGLKPFEDGKAGSSPSMQQPGRASSAMNSSGFGAAGGAGGAQSAYPPAQHQQGFGGYSSHSGGYAAQSTQAGGHTGAGYGNQYGQHGHGGLGGGFYGRGGHGGSAQSQQPGSQFSGYGSGW